MDTDWIGDLGRWLAPFLAGLFIRLGAGCVHCTLLTGPGERKSVQLMAARISDVVYDQLHHFVAAGVA